MLDRVKSFFQVLLGLLALALILVAGVGGWGLAIYFAICWLIRFFTF